jgi:tyrosyl-tRNA synthetase
VHGSTECQRAEEAAAALFGRGELATLPEPILRAAVSEVRAVEVRPGEERTLAELFEATGLVESRSAARRAATEGGLYVNNVRVPDALVTPGPGDWLHGRFLVLRRGKQNVAAARRLDT